MNHPQIGDRAAVQGSGSSIPWSAEGEAALRARIVRAWELLWACILSGILLVVIAVIRHDTMFLIGTAIFLGGGVVLLKMMQSARMRLGEEMRRLPNGQFYEGSGMLANKPRSTANLTRWIQHAATAQTYYAIQCECGRIHRPFAWKWIPNFDPQHFGEAEYPSPADPDGGRWVILCPCGLGHYKLKA